MTRTPGVQWKHPTPPQVAAIALNRWSYAYASQILTIWAGGKAADTISDIARQALGPELASQASQIARRVIMDAVRIRAR